jgi:hypothetical protein
MEDRRARMWKQAHALLEDFKSKQEAANETEESAFSSVLGLMWSWSVLNGSSPRGTD